LTETSTMVSTGPSSLPAALPLGRGRVATIVAVLIVLGATMIQTVRANRACDGDDFTYASDEAYVQLDLARRIAMTAPSPAAPWPTAAALQESASPAWTGLLAGIIRLAGQAPTKDAAQHARVEKLAPLVLNLALAAMLIMLVGHMLRHDVQRSLGMFSRLLLVAVCMPIPLLILTGGEHLAHAFVLVLAVASGIDLIEREPVAARRLLFSMLWMALAVALRYESLAVVFGLVLWAWIRRRIGRAVPAVLGGVGLAVGIAIYLAKHDQPWLPLPVWARLFSHGGLPSSWSEWAVDHAVANLREAMLPAALVVIAAVMLWSRREHQSSPDAEDRVRVGWLFVFLVAGATHLLVARAGGHFPYTAYLVPLGAVAILRALANRPGAKWAPSAPVGLRYAVMAVFCLLPLAVATAPTASAMWMAPAACAEVYQRDRMMARYVRVFPPDSPGLEVAAVEVGAVRYDSSARVHDVEAIARAGGAIADKAQLLFRVWRLNSLLSPPAGWVLIGDWKENNPGSQWRVEVYASPRMAGDARIAFEEFMRGLPESVVRACAFTKHAPQADEKPATRPQV
jgi:hypothetical protein